MVLAKGLPFLLRRSSFSWRYHPSRACSPLSHAACAEQCVAVRATLPLRTGLAVERLPRDPRFLAQGADVRFWLAHRRYGQPEFGGRHLTGGAPFAAPSACGSASNTASDTRWPTTGGRSP